MLEDFEHVRGRVREAARVRDRDLEGGVVQLRVALREEVREVVQQRQGPVLIQSLAL